MNRTYEYRLYPNKAQDEQLDFMLWQMRTVYNDALNERYWRWERSRMGTSYPEQWARFKQARYDFSETIGQLSATGIQQILRRLDKVFRAFLQGKRGRPRFQSRSRFKSMEYRYGDGCRLKDGRLYLIRVGEVKIKMHRPIPDDAKIKQVIVKRKLNKWYAYFQIELPPVELPVHDGPEVGIDVGLKSLLTLSDGTIYENPRWLRSSQSELRVLQRKLARQKKGGSNYKKTKYQIAKLHNKITNQRKDFWHKVTRELAKKYSVIHTENLRLAFMLRNHNLALSAHDAALGQFFQFLAYKVEETGSEERKKNPKNTSIECSGCGEMVPKSLSVRVHSCPYCGLTLDRDVNAAINIKARTEPLEPKVSGCAVLALKIPSF